MGITAARRLARIGRVKAPAILAGLVLLAASTASASAADTAAERLPDLRMKKLSGFYIQKTSSGDKRLRFNTIVVNSGAGKFELRGSRPSTSTSRMSITQRIYKSDGTTSRNVAIDPSDTWMFYAGDGHNHWHVYRLQRFTLRPVKNGVVGDIVGRAAKTGFCFYDNYKYNLSLSGAPQSAYYTGCGSSSSTQVKMGLSRGWGDKYSASMAYQWIKLNGVPDGDYRVRVTADYYNWFAESSNSNNYTWTDVRLSGGGTKVAVLRQGPGA
jgi:Lysyl oxidase